MLKLIRGMGTLRG